jgi:hypothetical protein
MRLFMIEICSARDKFATTLRRADGVLGSQEMSCDRMGLDAKRSGPALQAARAWRFFSIILTLRTRRMRASPREEQGELLTFINRLP